MKEAKLQLKQAAVADVVDKMKRAQSVVVLDYRGLTVAEVSDLRSKFREVGVEYKAVSYTHLVPPPEATEKYFLPFSIAHFLYVPATGCWKRVGFVELPVMETSTFS